MGGSPTFFLLLNDIMSTSNLFDDSCCGYINRVGNTVVSHHIRRCDIDVDYEFYMF